jgi:hypothetical protein
MSAAIRVRSRVFDVSEYAPEELALIERILGFDRAFYSREYVDVAKNGMDMLVHYLCYGVDEHRCPADFNAPLVPGGVQTWLEEVFGFDPVFYGRTYPDVTSNHAEHLISYGIREGRRPFDVHDNFASERILDEVLGRLGMTSASPLEACAQLSEEWALVGPELEKGASRIGIRPKPYRNGYWLAMGISNLANGRLGAAVCCYNFFFNSYVPNQCLGNDRDWLIGTGRILSVADAIKTHGLVLATPEVAPSAVVMDALFLNRPIQPREPIELPLPRPVYGTLSDVEAVVGTSLIIRGGHSVCYDYIETGPRARELQCPNLIHVIKDKCSYRLPSAVRSVEEAYWMLHDHGLSGGCKIDQ